MKLLESLLSEESKFTAIAKNSGKLVHFKTKQAKDAAVKSGTHKEPKNKKPDYFDKIQNYLKTKDLFKGDYDKKRNNKVKAPIQAKHISVISRKVDDIDNLYSKMVERWADKKEKNVFKIEKKVIKEQGDWVKKIISDKVVNLDRYNFAMDSWQRDVNKDALNSIDKFLKKFPPPPIQTNEPVYRGMIISKNDYLKMLQDFDNKKGIKIPIGSFTTFFDTATKFANPQSHPVADESHKNYSVIFRVKSECGNLTAFSMNSNIVSKDLRPIVKVFSDEHEILMPSNQKYKVDKIHHIKFSDKYSPAKSMAFIDLVQKCSKNEGIDDDVDLTNDKFYTDLFQTHMRLEKKGD